ncbi:MAG TPA: OpgC domain-containing protein [Casimicrobiaceae bacterium]|nr:OpgC domain-containing protein [Casimicrobiaceae bacterium]
MERQPELDWLRGLMLVLMTLTHVPTWFGAHLGQPFGFVSAAEGFVFLSAFLVGSVYSHTARKRGFAAMRRAALGRAAKVYAAHAAVLLFLLLVLVPFAALHGVYSITDLASFYVERPRVALVAGLALAYNPPLLDILPMYVLFIAASPSLIAFGTRRGWGPLLAISAALWLFAQLGGGRHMYASIARLVEWPVPYAQTGAFSLLAWQLMWLVGLRAGALKAETRIAARTEQPWPRWVVFGALALAAVFLVIRHVTGQVPSATHPSLNALFDKWHLGPLRLVNFAVLAILAVHWRGVLVAWASRSMIATLGRASLTVFTAHLVLCLAILATAGEALVGHASVEGAALVVGTLVTLYAVARVALAGERIVPAPLIAAAARRKVVAKID